MTPLYLFVGLIFRGVPIWRYESAGEHRPEVVDYVFGKVCCTYSQKVHGIVYSCVHAAYRHAKPTDSTQAQSEQEQKTQIAKHQYHQPRIARVPSINAGFQTCLAWIRPSFFGFIFIRDRATTSTYLHILLTSRPRRSSLCHHSRGLLAWMSWARVPPSSYCRFFPGKAKRK